MRWRARRFLAGLSSDELEFIAAFLGSCVLESQARCTGDRSQLAERVARFQQVGAECSPSWSCDREHKMIVLLEYLCQAGMHQRGMAARAGSASLN